MERAMGYEMNLKARQSSIRQKPEERIEESRETREDKVEMR